MKLRSLFLAGLAVMAMASCSNEDDAIVNGGENAAKDAVFNFGIAFPTSSNTRGTTVKPDEDSEGTALESNVNDITLVLTYANGAPTFTKTYDVSDFTKVGNKYTLTNHELVAPGMVNVKVYVNSNGVPADVLESKSAFDLGDYASTANKGNFFMSGKQDNLNIVAKSDNNEAKVSVDRVAAKLTEATTQEDYTFTATASSLTNAQTLSVKLTDYTYANLNKKSNALALGTTYFDANDFWNKFTTDENEDLWGIFGQDTKAMNGIDKDTYCFENNNSNVTTKIYYKAIVSVDGVTTKDVNFYVYKNVLYKNYAELNKVFNGSLEPSFGLTDGSTNSDFMTKVGVTKYTKGVCYYAADIKTAAIEANILRNNSYLLTVKSIKDLGLPEIDTPTPGDPTLLSLDVTVKNWTVNLNEIEL